MTMVVDWDVKHHLYHCKCKGLSIFIAVAENGVDNVDTAYLIIAFLTNVDTDKMRHAFPVCIANMPWHLYFFRVLR